MSTIDKRFLHATERRRLEAVDYARKMQNPALRDGKPLNYSLMAIKVPCSVCGRGPDQLCKKSHHRYSTAHRLPHKERVALAILAYE